jgi:serine/threonine protein kinase
MDKAGGTTERIFAGALELRPGRERNEFVATECAGAPELRSNVESLLHAHELSGDFLQPRPAFSRRPSKIGTRAGTVIMDAAAHADAFLHGAHLMEDADVSTFLGSIPDVLRAEVRERIEAGLRIRRMQHDGRQPPSRSEEKPPQLPGFRIERKLGQGGLGSVYAAYDEKLNRRVALKVLHRGTGEEIRRRVLEEARNTAVLSDPAVVTIFSVLDEAEPPAIVMELVEGFPLDRFAAELNFEQKARLLREVARGLAAAHERHLLHRDLKPDNVIVGPDMRPRILDFGLALSLEEAGQSGRGFEGTPLYASPEQVLGKPLTGASDVFSFGSLMFKVLTGRPPFAGETVREVLEGVAASDPPFLREVAVGVPEDLQAICLACLAWNAADRPSASQVAVELGRFLVGEPVRLRPRLYDDILRRSISEYSNQAQMWASQSIISSDERDAMEAMHRRLLADEDHWIIDARRITLLQAVLSGGTWLAVVATVLAVWMLRDELGPQWRWLMPAGFTLTLMLAGNAARRAGEALAAATFLAGAALAIAPFTLSLLARIGAFSAPHPGVEQLFAGAFTNQQVLAASLTALTVSVFALWRLKMTGFAWTTATLATTTYVSALLPFNWLQQKPEIQALWCMPLVAMQSVALVFERLGRVRWTMPFHFVALVALVGGLDVIALNGPTLQMLGIRSDLWPYFDHERQQAFSVLLNGMIFLALMLLTERSASLDLRRTAKLLEILAILHTLTPLFVNAMDHRGDAQVRMDVALYLGAALLFAALAAIRSRWRLLVGGLAGCGLGSYLLVDLGLVARKPFIIGLGLTGLIVALGAFAYVRHGPRAGRL